MCKTGKRRYGSELGAKIALTSTWASRKKKRQETRVYRCSFCEGWHLTSQPQRAAREGKDG